MGFVMDGFGCLEMVMVQMRTLLVSSGREAESIQFDFACGREAGLCFRLLPPRLPVRSRCRVLACLAAGTFTLMHFDSSHCAKKHVQLQ